MDSREFAYWLQGVIEIGEIETFTPRQVEIILDKIDHIDGNTSGFVSFTRGVLTIFEKTGSTQEGLLKVSFESVKNELQSHFQHVIDPTIEGDQNDLRRIHRGDRNNDGGDKKPRKDDGFQVLC